MRATLNLVFVLGLLSAAACNKPQLTEEIACDNGVDDDGDGFTDCDDGDCFQREPCGSFERCDDLTDNDKDGLIDCEDPDCAASDICVAPEVCDNGADDDQDTFADCADQDCFGDAACPLPPNQAILDLSVEQPGVARYIEDLPGGSFFGHPTEAGDVNGDGLADVASCALAASPGRQQGGVVDLFLSTGSIAGNTLPSAPSVIRIVGARPFDFLGSAAHLDDVTGDGLADLLLGAQGGDGPNEDRIGAGQVFVIAGAANLPGTIDLANPPQGATITTITGEREGDRLGIWVGAGDVDGDGVRDLLLGADQNDGPAGDRGNAGAVYALSGQGLPARVDLAALTPGEGPLIAKWYGKDAGDHLGGTLFAGDLDGDGDDDVVIAAAMNRLSASLSGPGEDGQGGGGGDGPDNDRQNAGENYVFFGPVSGEIDLLTEGQASHATVFGVDQFDAAGEELVIADMDNDGAGELLLGALTLSRPGAAAVGATYIIPSSLLAPGEVIDLAAPPAEVIIFLGDEPGEISGDTLAAPDLDGDGIRELAVARPSRSVPRDGVLVPAAGRVLIFFDPMSFSGVVDLRALSPELDLIELWGVDADDTLAYSMTSADVDGDGIEDLLPNVMRGDGADEDLTDAGEIYVLSGAFLRSLIVR